MARPCGEFKARLEKRPDSPGVLTVTGECNLPAVYRAVLEAHDPPGETPGQLVLDLVVTLPSGLPPTTVEGYCTLNLAFKTKTEQEYKTVLIKDRNSEDGESWEIPVRVLTQQLADVRPDGTRWSKMSRPGKV